MKKPFLSYEKAVEIKKRIPTPYHVYSEKGILENIDLLKQSFAWNKGFKQYFAVKATPNPVILKIMKENGFGVDCSSMTELMMADKLGFKGEDIMFSSNETPIEEYEYALKLRAIINIDDISHIPFLEKLAPLPELISLRFNPGGQFLIGNQIMGNPEQAKYGLTKNQIIEGIKYLSKKGVKRFGLHAFLASNNLGNEYYPELARHLFELTSEIQKRYDVTFGFINLSGGIGVPYRPEDESVDIIKVGKGVEEIYNKYFEDDSIAIFTELGRYMLAPFGGLVTEVLHFKNTYKHYVGVDACAANLMRPAMYGAYHHITVLGKENIANEQKYDIVGSLCENNDKFAIDRELPTIDYGDLLFIHDTGAHGHAMGYNYNGKLRSAEVLLKTDETFELIRRAETPKDYFATLDIFPEFRE